MPVQCIDCLRAGQKQKAPPQISKAGGAACALERNKGTYVSLTYRRECQHFVPAPADLVAARRAWLEDQR